MSNDVTDAASPEAPADAEPERNVSKPRRVLRVLLAVLATLVVVVLALFALVIIFGDIPQVAIPVAIIVGDFGLYLVVFAVLALVLAALVLWSGLRRTGLALCLVAVLGLVATLFPLVASLRAASDYGASVSVGDYLEGDDNTGKPVTSLSVVYHRADGKALKLDAKVPRGTPARPRPAVVWVHGGGWNVGDRGEVPMWHKWLNDRGYAVFAIDYRLAPPPRWQQAPGDVKCAIGWVKRHAARYHVDPNRVMIAGGSAGGNLTLMGAYSDDRVKPSCPAKDTSVKAVVAFYPAVSVRLTWQETGWPDQVRPWAQKYTGGTPAQVPSHYKAASADTYVRPGLPPTLIIHGDRDHIAPYEGSRMLAHKLEAAGVPHQLVTVPYADHIFDFTWGSWGTQISRHVFADFLKEHLPR